MKRLSAAATLVLTAIVLTTACAPTGRAVEDHVLEAVASDSPVRIADLVADGGATRFTIVCPYELPEDVAARLEIAPGGIPDLSDRDDAQALVVVTADGVTAAEFPRDRVDLCADDGGWPVYPGDADATASVTRNADDVYVATRER